MKKHIENLFYLGLLIFRGSIVVCLHNFLPVLCQKYHFQIQTPISIAIGQLLQEYFSNME